jgi:pyruvate,orthophosphate dikinase
MAPPQLDGPITTVLAWADAIRDMDVRTNADTPVEAMRARELGAAGIGLIRTEHMFFAPGRISAVREMILAGNQADCDRALAKLLPFQRDDFRAILDTMDGLPVTIRLLDPPLHEFLPREAAAIVALAAELEMPVAQLTARIEALSEANPMMGHRGCRLLVSHPEIAAMQARAVYEAAAALTRAGKNPLPEIMIPLVGLTDELQRLRTVVEQTAAQVAAEQDMVLPVSVGTMIELPRACLVADRIAEKADFFSFGTNDLTQFTFGFSRDDTGRFLGQYKDGGVLKDDPFATIDQDGVGGLMRTAIDRSSATRPTLKRGVCGEHGGDPASIHFCHQLGLDYVSCSPFRVPVARLAAAHAALAQPRTKAAPVADEALAMAAE